MAEALRKSRRDWDGVFMVAQLTNGPVDGAIPESKEFHHLPPQNLLWYHAEELRRILRIIVNPLNYRAEIGDCDKRCPINLIGGKL